MTDQTIPADKVKKVADWLWEDILANGGMDEEVAPQLAARTEMAEEVRRLLLALLPTPKETTMTDQTIPADKVRKIAIEMRDAMRREDDGCPYVEFLSDMGDYIRDLEELLPPPPPPTLAHMTDEERAACQWMQADIIGGDEPLVIARLDLGDGSALILDRNGRADWVPAEHVTPRPDLPRLEWPGDTPAPAPALPDGWRLADHPKHGRVIVTTQTPNGGGRVYFVLPVSRNLMGFDWRACGPDELTYLGQEADQ